MASINYNDKRFTKVEADKNVALKENNALYDGMINQSDSFYKAQTDAINQYRETQKANQQAQTDFAIEKIEQQKDEAYKDFQKEGSAAYVDWQKQTDDYGSNAEKMASMGLAHSGYSEQSKVAMYNQYQNRVALARETYNKAVMNYNNMITEARLQNNSALAEIGFNTLMQSLEISLAGFQYKNNLLQQKTQAKRDIDNTYYSRYQDVVNQINTENSLAEQQRQYNLSRELELKKYNESVRQYNETLKEEKRQFNETMAYNKKKNSVSGSSGSSGGSGSVKKSSSSSSGSDSVNKNSSSYKNQTLKEKQAALKKVSSVKTKKDAQNLLKSLGLSSSISIIDSVTWNKAKRLGDGGSDVQNFKNYAEYVQAYCKGVINSWK